MYIYIHITADSTVLTFNIFYCIIVLKEERAESTL